MKLNRLKQELKIAVENGHFIPAGSDLLKGNILLLYTMPFHEENTFSVLESSKRFLKKNPEVQVELFGKTYEVKKVEEGGSIELGEETSLLTYNKPLGIQKVTLVFENCEFVDIPYEYIGKFTLENFETKVERQAMNSINKYTVAKDFFIEIKSSFKYSGVKTIFTDIDPTNIFDRIAKYKDITYVELHFENEEVEIYFTDWTNGSECANENQKVYITKYGDLMVQISEKDLDKELSEYTELDGYSEYFLYWDMFSPYFFNGEILTYKEN